MSAKEKARPTVAAVRQANGNKSVTANFPHENFITETGQTQGHIESLLTAAGAFGESSALSASELCSQAGLSDCRAIRHEVNAERANGSLILSGDSGYFLPSPGEAGRQEIRHFVARLESQAWSLHKATSPARRALENLDGQFSLIDAINEGRV